MDRPSRSEITGLVLAGGRGTRMGGADKGWVVHDGEPLVTAVVRRFAPQVGALLISANRNLDAYRALGTVVTDDEIGPGLESFPGPLGGVLAGLRRATTEWVATVPCDAPALPLDLVGRLVEGLGDAPAAYAEAAERGQPVFALLRRSEEGRLAEYLRTGERGVLRWYALIGARPVHFPDAAAFRNVNEPAPLHAPDRAPLQ
jgi:molybdopterin-guanine dinucleotide biosynthesis protein A